MTDAPDRPPGAVHALVATGFARHTVQLVAVRRLARYTRRRALLRRRHVRPLAALERRGYVLNVVTLAALVVLAVFLLRGSRVAWWVRLAFSLLGLVLTGLTLLGTTLRPPGPDPALAVITALAAVEVGLARAPSVRRFYARRPRPAG